jgi:CheY-like chemotaxis protein
MFRILHIEDIPSDAYLIRREVTKVLDPCEFRVVEDNDVFLEALLEFKPDIIISDFSIPGFDWHKALHLSRKHAPLAPFIVVTGSISDEINNACITAGVTDFISKDDIYKLGPVITRLFNL